MALALITGAAGFTGDYLVRELSACGIDSAGIGIEPPPAQSSLQQYIQTDMLDAPSMNDAVRKIRPDYVFHLAGMSHVVHGNPASIYSVNIMAARNLLTALSSLDHAPAGVLLASTANLYGNQEGILDENTPPAPMNDYAVSKLAMEYMAALFRDQLPITIVRPFNYTGRGQSPAFLVPKLVLHFRERRESIELGNIDVTRDFSDVRDVARRYVRLALAKNAGWGPFNFCSGVGLTIRDILDILGQITGHSPEIKINPDFVRKNEVRRLIGSDAKLDGVIGRFNAIPFGETLRWMLEA